MQKTLAFASGLWYDCNRRSKKKILRYKTMKKFAFGLMTAAALTACLFSAVACGDNSDFVANDATDLLQEDFGIAVKKGDTEMKAAVDEVVDEWKENGNMDKYFSYYNDLADESKTATAPDGLKLTWDLSANTEELHMYTESGFAPYEFVHTSGYAVSDGSAQDGSYKVAGIDVAIACQVAENLNCKLVIHDVAFDSIITHLDATDGKALAAAGMTISEERKQSVDFSNIYSSSTLSIVCAKDAGYTTLKSLDGLTIGVQEGTSGDLIASAAITSEGYTYTVTNDDETETDVNIKLTSADTHVTQYKTYAAALAALKSGKIDVIFMDKVPAQLLLANA